MKYFLLSLSVAAVLTASALPAFAQAQNAPVQNGDSFENEFQAFKKKVDAAGGTAPANAATAATNTNAAAAPSSVSAYAPMDAQAAPNPLGPAGNLPLNGNMPSSYGIVGQTPEEIRLAMEAENEAQRKKMEELVFEDAMKSLMPLTPNQITRMLDKFKENREAAETPILNPTPKVQVETVSLDPSQVPAVIKTAQGRVTTLTIVDATGSPWPIQDVSWAGKFEVTGPEEGAHVIRITPMTTHGAGNISIRLVDLITPITFTIQAGIDEVYYRFDARIPKQGPLAKTPLIEYGGLKASVGGDDNLVQVLDGTPPADAEKLTIDGVDGRTRAWRVAGHMYLRTPLTLLSPSWDSSVTSADGMNVYTLNDTPVILLSDDGRVVRAHIASDEVNNGQ